MPMLVGEDILPQSDFEVEFYEDFSSGWDLTNRWTHGLPWNTTSWGNNYIPNNEKQFYIDPNNPPDPSITYNPFGVNGAGEGTIGIKRTTSAESQHVGIRNNANSQTTVPADYIAGCVTTRNHYSHWQGRLEANIRIPRGRGLFPAFWSFPYFADGVWEATPSGVQEEIDVLEAHGHYTNQYFTTLHDNSNGTSLTSQGLDHSPGFDLSTRICRYTFDWNDDQMGFGFEGKYNYVVPTPSDFKDPAKRRALILNVAAYSNWTYQQIAITEGNGHISAPEIYPTSMAIQSVAAYAGKWTFQANRTAYDLKFTRTGGGGLFVPTGRTIV